MGEADAPHGGGGGRLGFSDVTDSLPKGIVFETTRRPVEPDHLAPSLQSGLNGLSSQVARASGDQDLHGSDGTIRTRVDVSDPPDPREVAREGAIGFTRDSDRISQRLRDGTDRNAIGRNQS